MLQHSTSYKLANDGHDTRALQHYTGHKTLYTRFDTPKWRLIGSGISGRTDKCSKTKPDLRVLRPGRDAWTRPLSRSVTATGPPLFACFQRHGDERGAAEHHIDTNKKAERPDERTGQAGDDDTGEHQIDDAVHHHPLPFAR